MNAVVVAVLLMLVLSLLRVNIIIALMIGALAGGLTGGLGLGETVKAFTDGLGGSVCQTNRKKGRFAEKSTVKSVNRTDYFNHILFLTKRGARSHCVYSCIDSAAFKNI